MTEEKLKRTPMAKKVKQMVKLLRDERPDYHYLRELFKRVRHEMDIEVLQKARRLTPVCRKCHRKNVVVVRCNAITWMHCVIGARRPHAI